MTVILFAVSTSTEQIRIYGAKSHKKTVMPGRRWAGDRGGIGPYLGREGQDRISVWVVAIPGRRWVSPPFTGPLAQGRLAGVVRLDA
jgi:hypothetical protein